MDSAQFAERRDSSKWSINDYGIRFDNILSIIDDQKRTDQTKTTQKDVSIELPGRSSL